MKKITTSLLAIVLGTLAFGTPSQAAEWQLAKNKNGVKVYTKDVEGSSLKAFRGETIIEAKITDVAFLFNNTASYTKWLADISYSKLVKKVSDTDQYVYLIQKAPVIKDRDVIAHGVVTQDPSSKVLTVNLSAASGMVKENPKYVRIPKMDGKFTFTPIGGGKLKVVYELTANPGGSIPAAVANQFAIDTPYKTLVNLKDISDELEQFRDPNMSMIFKDAS